MTGVMAHSVSERYAPQHNSLTEGEFMSSESTRPGDESLQTCDQCGNRFHDSMEITHRGRVYHFDSFECAITALAPRCTHCECRIIGHGVETDGSYFCCEHCARNESLAQDSSSRARSGEPPRTGRM